MNINQKSSILMHYLETFIKMQRCPFLLAYNNLCVDKEIIIETTKELVDSLCDFKKLDSQIIKELDDSDIITEWNESISRMSVEEILVYKNELLFKIFIGEFIKIEI